MVYYKDLEANQFVIPGSNYHMRMTAQQRLQPCLRQRRLHQGRGAGASRTTPSSSATAASTPSGSRRPKPRPNLDDAVLVGEGHLDGQEVVVALQDFRFMAGSLGMAAGEAVVTGMLRAVDKGVPFILFAASGGARMQEGILSLMQMPRTTIAVQRLREARLPYIVVLTDPTTGRRHGLLRHAGRRAHRRARGAHLLCRARASSSKRSASSCPKASRRPSISSRTA